MAELIDPAAAAWAEAHTTRFAGQLAEVVGWTETATAAPQMMAGRAEARLLQALIAVSGARTVLEIGTFTGVGALAMAAALPPGGRVITLELDPENAVRARAHFAASSVGERIELIEGDALTTLAALDGPFDLVWIDAWKADYPAYWDLVVPKLSERGIVAADNLFRDGAVLDPAVTDAGTVGMRTFAGQVHADDRFDNVLLTVGDGVMLAWRRPASA